MYFLNNFHKNNYLKLLEKANIHVDDIERKSLFYIISGNDDLFEKKNSIYDFKNKWIDFNCLDSDIVDFCSSSKALIRLGFNLYNGYIDDYTNPLTIMSVLDSSNYEIAKKAIDIRLGK